MDFYIVAKKSWQDTIKNAIFQTNRKTTIVNKNVILTSTTALQNVSFICIREFDKRIAIQPKHKD